MLTRYVMRKFWPFGEVATLEVADDGVHHLGNGCYQLHKPFRKATAADLCVLAGTDKGNFHRNFHDRKLSVGTRVRVKNGKFSGGALGTVVFQEPAGGRVWVERDGAGSPVYYWNDELIVLKYAKEKVDA